MHIEHTERGFEYVRPNCGQKTRLRQSSAILDYEDSLDRPGTSAIWYDGEHLDRDDVRERLEANVFDKDHVPYIEAWLKTGSFKLEKDMI